MYVLLKKGRCSSSKQGNTADMEVYRLTSSQFAIDHGRGMKGESSTMPRIKCYLSSHKTLSGKWVPSRFVSFKLGPRIILDFHEDGTMGNSTPLFRIYSRISFCSARSDLCQIFGCSIQFEVRYLFTSAHYQRVIVHTQGYGRKMIQQLKYGHMWCIRILSLACIQNPCDIWHTAWFQQDPYTGSVWLGIIHSTMKPFLTRGKLNCYGFEQCWKPPSNN